MGGSDAGDENVLGGGFEGFGGEAVNVVEVVFVGVDDVDCGSFVPDYFHCFGLEVVLWLLWFVVVETNICMESEKIRDMCINTEYRTQVVTEQAKHSHSTMSLYSHDAS